MGYLWAGGRSCRRRGIDVIQTATICPRQKVQITVEEESTRGAVALHEVRHPNAVRLALLRHVELKSLLEVADKAQDLDVMIGGDPQVHQLAGFFIHGNVPRERMRELLLEFSGMKVRVAAHIVGKDGAAIKVVAPAVGVTQ